MVALYKKSILCLLIVFYILNIFNLNIAFANEDLSSVLDKKKYVRSQMDLRNIGESIFFGNYEQNGIESDGKEPIEWIILKKDVNNDSAILISKYILDCFPFNAFNTKATWENCSLRNYMNTTMLVEMFDEVELSCVLPTFLLNSGNIFNGAYSGSQTYDFLFIPGIDEMLAFFSNANFVNEARINELTKPNAIRVCYATQYAKNRGVRVLSEKSKYSGAGNYFLRTSGLPGRRKWYNDVYADYFQSFVTENGAIHADGTSVTSVDDGIRPMVQISY